MKVYVNFVFGKRVQFRNFQALFPRMEPPEDKCLNCVTDTQYQEEFVVSYYEIWNVLKQGKFNPFRNESHISILV